MPSQEKKKACRVCDDFRHWDPSSSTPAIPHPTKKDAYTPFPCPPDSRNLGTHSWTLLHTMAAYYPSKPEPSQKSLMSQFITSFSAFYPCGYCADHLQEYIKKNPPTLDSNVQLSNWWCLVHNDVNQRLGKPIFDCSRVFERWKDGREGDGC